MLQIYFKTDHQRNIILLQIETRWITFCTEMRKDWEYPYTQLHAVWPDWAIYWIFGKFLKSLATINLSKSPTFLFILCKGVKVYHFSSEILGNFYRYLAIFFCSHCCWNKALWSVVVSRVLLVLTNYRALFQCSITPLRWNC